MVTLEKTEEFVAFGHELILATHKTTFEFTKEKHLTRKGDCIVAINSNRSLVDLESDFKEHLRNLDVEVTIMIEAGTEKEKIKAWGHPKLMLNHPTDMVVRKSEYICSRTLAVKADKAAKDLSRKLVETLQDPKQVVKITVSLSIG